MATGATESPSFLRISDRDVGGIRHSNVVASPTEPSVDGRMTENEKSEIRTLVASGNKIAAIKRHRELTGSDLVTAKSTVEALVDGKTPVERKSSPELRQEVVALLESSQQIDAIRVYREATGVGLKEARDRIRAIAMEERIPLGGAGCFGMVVLAFLTAYSLHAIF